MKNIIKNTRNGIKKMMLLCLFLLGSICSFAQSAPAKHMVWAYDGILPYIAYVIFGLLVVSMIMVSLKSWWDNSHHDHIPHHQ
jgi:hypothetical protein